MTEIQTHPTQQRTISRKKFTPVKVACLACRASRIRCDGKEACSPCVNRGRECVYVKSKRGGPRHKKPDYLRIAQDCLDEVVPPMVKPGAGLTQLDQYLEDNDNLFDSIFSSTPAAPLTVLNVSNSQPYGSVRRYRSDVDLLNAYYVWLHPFFPILPPGTIDHKDTPHLWYPELSSFEFDSRSPIGLAVSTILALVPHPEEKEPFHEESIKIRRHAAHRLAKCTLDRIESDSELPDSAISPAQALSQEIPKISRPPFHPSVPIELETVIALGILSVYEYSQRGNIPKMRDRAGQALISAMNISLHDRGAEQDAFSEARRRAWWMTYICACQASIVSCTPPTISMFDARFTTSFPTIASDAEAWPFFIKSQQTILSATEFVAEVGRAVDSRKGDWQAISNRMQELHAIIEPLLATSESWSLAHPTVSSYDDPERVVAFALRQMSKIKLNSARIKLHRYCAFFDIPVFSEKHCDLKKSNPLGVSPDIGGPLDQAALGPSCCSHSLPTGIAASNDLASPSDSTSSAFSFSDDFAHPFQFSSHDSSRVCLRSALNIAEAFDAMPLPRSTSTTSQVLLLPRTMPSFACCAMQSAYALLMVYHQTWIVSQNQNNQLALTLLNRCEAGLRSILTALSNYSIAFEALGGMRDQIQAALDCLSLPNESL